MKNGVVIGLSLMILSSLVFGATDWNRFGLNGKVKAIAFGDTTFLFSESGVLISDIGRDTLDVQYNSLHQPVFQVKGKKKIFYKYGFNGVLVKKTSCSVGREECLSKEFEYNNENGLLITESHCITKGDDYACPNYIKFVYDSLNRLSERKLYDSIGTEKKRISYEYNSKGFLHEDLEVMFEGDQKKTLRYCEYINDLVGNWISRKCFENHKVFETHRNIEYYAIPFDENNAHHDSISMIMDTSLSEESLSPWKSEGRYPFTAGLVRGSLLLAENVLVDLHSSIAGLFGKVKTITRKELLDNGHIRSNVQETFDESGNLATFLNLDSINDTLASARFSKTSKGFDYEISRPGNFFEKGFAKLEFNSEGDWSSALDRPFIHSYDKLNRMVRRNLLRFEYNSDGFVEKIWHSDVVFDFLFFDVSSRVKKIVRYNCESGNCNVVARAKIKTDTKGNAIAENWSFVDGSGSLLVQTEIEYYD